MARRRFGSPERVWRTCIGRDADQLLPAYAAAGGIPLEFFVRMVFSCLVDADWLDTERHFSPETLVCPWAIPQHRGSA